MKRIRFVSLLLALLLVWSQGFTQRQGIRGQVFRSPEESTPAIHPSDAEPQFGMICQVEIYKVTTQDQAIAQAENHFDSVMTERVAAASTRADGSFKVKLPPGDYSVFVRLPNGLYSDQIDQNGRIGYVEVRQNTFSWHTIVVDN